MNFSRICPIDPRGLLAPIVLSVPLACSNAQPTFYMIGNLAPGGHSSAYAVSLDGSTVVGSATGFIGGNSQDLQDVPIMWTVAGGLRSLPTTPFLHPGVAYTCSGDGSIVAGFYNVFGRHKAVTWGPDDAFDYLTPTIEWSEARDISADGNTVVGWGIGPWRWTPTGGVELLYWLPGGGGGGIARAVSADGTTIVGSTPSDQVANQEAFVWREETGMVGLGVLRPGHDTNSVAWDVSSDGSVIVGLSSVQGTNDVLAFRWTEAGGMVELPSPIPNAKTFSVWAMSPDGRFAFGYADSPAGGAQVVWDGVVPYRLDCWLQHFGVAPALNDPNVYGSSMDAETLCGGGNSAGITLGWVVKFGFAPGAGCPSDINHDGFVDGLDYDTFMNAFEAGRGTADYNIDCYVDGIDYDQFVNDFEAGC